MVPRASPINAMVAMLLMAVGCSQPAPIETQATFEGSRDDPDQNVQASGIAPVKDAETSRLESMRLGECLDRNNKDNRCYGGRTVEELNDEARREVLASLRSESKHASMCWEGYCPCKPPQGGPDQLLCDQLRMGNVDPQLLSVGKSMRATRREIAPYHF